MSFLKNIFAKKEDDVPQMHVRQNEPKPYFNKDLKCWMIPGEEEEKMKELQERSKGPPKIKKEAISSTQVKVTMQTKKKTGMANRYASALATDNVIEEQTSEEKITEETQVIKSFTQAEESQQEQKPTESIENTMYYSMKENVVNVTNNNVEKEVTMTEVSEQIHKSIAHDNIREIEENIRRRLEEHFNIQYSEMENNLSSQIEELRETLQFVEETSQEEQDIIKGQLNNFIRENLELKLENERVQDELNFKQKEIDQYHNLLENYRKTIEEIPKRTSSNDSVDSVRSDDFVLINTKIEKLEFDKLILNNDIAEAKRENSNLNLEKSFIEYKLKEVENNYAVNTGKLKENLMNLEKKCLELELQNKMLLKGKESLEKECKRTEELSKQNDELMSKLNENNKDIKLLRDEKEMSNQENKNLNQLNDHLKSEVNNLKKSLEEKDTNYTKVIKELRQKVMEQKGEMENIREQKEENSVNADILKGYVAKINENEAAIFNQHKSILNYQESLEKLRHSIINSLKSISKEIENHDKIEACINRLVNLSLIKDFVLEFSSAFKIISNEFINGKLERQLLTKEKTLLLEEIENLKTEVEILNDSRNHLTYEVTKSKEILNETKEKNSKKLKLMEDQLKGLEQENEELQGKANREDVERELNKLKNLVNQLNETLRNESNEKEMHQSRINFLRSENSSLSEDIKILHENMFKLSFTNEKISQEVKDRENILEYIMMDIDSTLNTEESEEESMSGIVMESKLANKIKSLRNLLEKYQNYNLLMDKELEFYKEDALRKETTGNLLEEQILTMNSRNNLLAQENQNLKQEKRELENSLQEIREELERLKNTPVVDVDLINEKDSELESLREKARKLKELLDNTVNHYEQGIENLKTKQRQKLSEMKNSLQELTKEIENRKEQSELQAKELLALKEQSDSQIQELSREKEDFKASLDLSFNELNQTKEFLSHIIKENNPLIKFYNIDDLANDPQNLLIILINSLKNNLDYLTRENNEKDNTILQFNFLRQEHEDNLKRLSLLEKEQDVLMDNLNDKNKEINDLKIKISDLEASVEKSQMNLNEANRNYDYLLKNYKSAERLNELQKKIQHLGEEKATITQSHGLIVESLTKEINDLTEKLNKYQKQEKEFIQDLDVEEIPKEETKELEVTSEEKSPHEIKTQCQPPEMSNNPPGNQKANLGFFSRLLAPIFMTENELDSINQKTSK